MRVGAAGHAKRSSLEASAFGRARQLGCFFALVSAAILWFGLSRVWKFTIDDAGIVYAYAKHLAQGVGFKAAIGGPIVEGYSDFLWVVALVPFELVGLDVQLSSKVLGAVLGVVAIAVAAHLAGLSRERLREGFPWEALVPVVLLGLCVEYVVWLPSGLENALYSAALALLLLLDRNEAKAPRGIPSSWIAAVALCLTRPEGILYAGVIGCCKLARALTSPEHRRQLVWYASSLLVLLGLYSLWHYATFHSLVPNTYFAKAVKGDGWRYLRNGLKESGFGYVLPLGALGLWSHRSGPSIRWVWFRLEAPLLGCVAAAAFFVVFSGGDWMPHARFVSYGMLPLAILAAFGVRNLAELVARSVLRPGHRSWIALGATSMLAMFWAVYQIPRFDHPRVDWCHYCSRLEDARAFEMIRDRLMLRTASLLTHDVGGPMYASNERFHPLDIVGLCDPGGAKIEYDRRRSAHRYRLDRLQYHLHERGYQPTFVFFSENFWRDLYRSPEYSWGYFRYEQPRLGRKKKRFLPSWLHRGAFVSYTPEIRSYRFEKLDEQLTLVGLGLGSGDRAVVSLQRTPSARQLSLRLRAGSELGAVQVLFEQELGIGRHFRDYEPLRVELELPRGFQSAPALELGWTQESGGWNWHRLPSARALRVDEVPALNPFPENLPGTNDPALTELRLGVAQLVARRLRGDFSLRDPELAERLVQAGEAAFARGDRNDAYVAWVLALRADPEKSPTLHPLIHQTRPAIRSGYLTEYALLRELYRSRDVSWGIVLVAHLARERRWIEVEQIARQLRESQLSPELEAQLLSLERAVKEHSAPPDGIGRQPIDLTRLFPRLADARSFAPVDPAQGERLLGSRSALVLESRGRDGNRDRGVLRSAPFAIEGRALSFLLAGNRRTDRLRVELRVNGKVVKKAASKGGGHLWPVLWDLSHWRGSRAELRVIDEEKKGFLSLDELRWWDPTPEAP